MVQRTALGVRTVVRSRDWDNYIKLLATDFQWDLRAGAGRNQTPPAAAPK